MRLLYVAEPPNACWLYRVKIPGDRLAKIGHEVRVRHMEASPRDLEWADLVVIQKRSEPRFLRMLERAQAAGKKVLYEVDDDVFSVPVWNPAHRFYQGRRQALTEFVRRADGVTASTGPLAEVMGRLNDRVAILPNCIDREMVDAAKASGGEVLKPLDAWMRPISPDEYRARTAGKFVVGWFGSPTHRMDLEVVSNPLAWFVRANSDVVLVMVGSTTASILRQVPKDRLLCLEVVAIESWYRLLAQFGWDVALAPVEDCPFNASKSHLKALEAMAFGMVPVVSDTVTYRGTVVNGENGFLCGSDRDWFRALTQLKMNKALAGKIRKGAVETAAEWEIGGKIDLWEKFYGGFHG